VSDVHPELDLALLDVPEAALLGSVEPIGASELSPEGYLGGLAQLAGFGTDIWQPPDARRFVVERVVRVTPTTIVVDGEGRSGACDGDSGGPLLLRGATGAPEVVGVLSTGSQSCVREDEYTRVDVVRAWLAGRASAAPLDRSCGGITASGACFGSTAVRCSDGVLEATRCEGGARCVWTAAGSYGCDALPSTACGALDQVGVCEGDLARHCSEGRLVEVDCAAEGARCAAAPATGVAGCHSP
jgi:hypothetical protein